MATTTPHTSSRKVRVLFIGNSLTYYNQSVNKDFKSFLSKDFDEIQVDEVTQGGATLQILWRANKARRMIERNAYSVVVIQEDLPETTVADFHKYGHLFINFCRQHGCRPVLFMAWGYDRIPAMTNRIIEHAHRKLAKTTKCDVAPVMLARLECQSFKSVELPSMFDADLEHPSPEGTFLAALVIFVTVMADKRWLLNHPITHCLPGMDPNVLLALQHVSTSVCSLDWSFEESCEKKQEVTKPNQTNFSSTDATPMSNSSLAPPVSVSVSVSVLPPPPPLPPSPPLLPPLPPHTLTLGALPGEMIVRIGTFLSAEDLTESIAICCSWKTVVIDPAHDVVLWEVLYQRDFPKAWAFHKQILEMKVGVGRRSNSAAGRLRRFRKAYLAEQESVAHHEAMMSMTGC